MFGRDFHALTLCRPKFLAKFLTLYRQMAENNSKNFQKYPKSPEHEFLDVEYVFALLKILHKLHKNFVILKKDV